MHTWGYCRAGVICDLIRDHNYKNPKVTKLVFGYVIVTM